MVGRSPQRGMVGRSPQRGRVGRFLSVPESPFENQQRRTAPDKAQDLAGPVAGLRLHVGP